MNSLEMYIDFRDITDSRITLSDFEDYYTYISATIDRDDYFQSMMYSVWRISNQQQSTEGEVSTNASAKTIAVVAYQEPLSPLLMKNE